MTVMIGAAADETFFNGWAWSGFTISQSASSHTSYPAAHSNHARMVIADVYNN